MGSSIRSWHQFLFYVDWTKGHWLLNKKHLHHPSAHFPSGRPKGCVITVPVEEFLQHPDSAAGAQTAHDDERKQQALPTTWEPGVQQLKFLLLFITLWHTHTYMCTHTHAHACMHAYYTRLSAPTSSFGSLPLDGERDVQVNPDSWPGAQSFFEVHSADQTLQNKNTVHLTIMLFFMIFVFYIQIVKWLECTNYVCFLGFSHVVTVSPWCMGILSHFSIQSTLVPTNIFKVPSYCW